ncbi:MAG: hypothetical protein ACRDRO_27660 [Pseudonocardiaceae bacterium]
MPEGPHPDLLTTPAPTGPRCPDKRLRVGARPCLREVIGALC